MTHSNVIPLHAAPCQPQTVRKGHSDKEDRATRQTVTKQTDQQIEQDDRDKSKARLLCHSVSSLLTSRSSNKTEVRESAQHDETRGIPLRGDTRVSGERQEMGEERGERREERGERREECERESEREKESAFVCVASERDRSERREERGERREERREKREERRENREERREKREERGRKGKREEESKIQDWREKNKTRERDTRDSRDSSQERGETRERREERGERRPLPG